MGEHPEGERHAERAGSGDQRDAQPGVRHRDGQNVDGDARSVVGLRAGRSMHPGHRDFGRGEERGSGLQSAVKQRCSIVYGGGEEDAGGVRSSPCCSRSNQGPRVFQSPEQRRCLYECVRMHEQAHANQMLVADENICKDKRRFLLVLASTRGEKERTERQAYQVELRCLSGARRQLPCCQSLIDQRINQLTGMLADGSYAH